MRAVYLLGVAAVQASASLAVEALKLEFNRELSVSFANKGITFAASQVDVPYDLLMDVERADGGEGNGKDKDKDKESTVVNGAVTSEEDESIDEVSSDPVTTTIGTSEEEGTDEVSSDPVMTTTGASEQRNCQWETTTSSSYDAVSIRVVVSSTLSSDDYDKIAQWVTSLYETAAASSYKNIDVVTVIVPGGPSYTSGEETTGGAYSLLANTDEDPYAPLRTYGEVYETLDDPQLTAKPCQAVFSFVDDQSVLDQVLAYESGLSVDTAINFQVCVDGSCCTSAEEFCTALHRIDDAFLYSPLTFTREMSCANVLENGVPVIYVDSYGSRSCYCACPAGYVEDSSSGKSVCTAFNPPPCKCEWNKRSGYRKEICSIPPAPAYGENVDRCTFSKVATDWKVPVPYPTDGYVADARNNGDISKDNAPRVQITVSKLSNPVYDYTEVMATVTDGKLPHQLPEYPSLNVLHEGGSTVVAQDKNYSWSFYHSDRDDIVDALAFHGYGKYQLELDAYDYYGSASCPGCLSIVDAIRPKSTHTCPAGLGDIVDGTSTGSGSQCAHSAPLTKDNLKAADGLVEKFYEFDDDADNDVCGENKRCDVQSYKERKFYEDAYCDKSGSYDSGAECFSETEVLNDFLNNPTSSTNPLKTTDGKCHGEDAPVPPNQCTRCCDYHTELREWWVDYKCGYGYDTERCSGTGADSEKCALHQCLVLDGANLATAQTNIHAEIVDASKAVLTTLGDAAYDFDTVTQIHDALECSNYGELYAGRCTYEKTLSELISAQVDFSTQFNWKYGSDASEYVFWRYNIPNHQDGWQLWNPYKDGYGNLIEAGDKIVFERPKTVIVVEAWSQCGRVARFEYSVHLHLQSVINVCDYFSDMWYQTTVANRLDNGTFCAYPGSDFAELTFDFHADTGLKNTPDRAKLTLASVSCIGSIDDRQAVTLLESSTPNADIVSRFGIQMLNNDKTEEITNFEVLCTFTYTGPNGFKEEQICPKTFPIRDCKAPCFDTHADHCDYTGCAGKEAPGLYEACGGTIVSADKTSMYISSTEKQCCQGCTSDDMQVSCVSLLHLPSDTQDLKRCQPLPKSGYSSGDYNAHGHGHGKKKSSESTTTTTGDASPYGDTSTTTTTTTSTGAYDLLADTFPRIRTIGGGESYGTEAMTTTTTAYGDSDTSATVKPYGSDDSTKSTKRGGLLGSVIGAVRNVAGSVTSTVGTVTGGIKDKLQGGGYGSSTSTTAGNSNGNYGGTGNDNTGTYTTSNDKPTTSTTTYGNGKKNHGDHGDSDDSNDTKTDHKKEGNDRSDGTTTGYGNDATTGTSTGETTTGYGDDGATTTTTDNTSTTTGTGGYTSTTATTAYGLLATASSVAQEHPEALALLGSSAFVAVVALVVVKRRTDAIRKEQMENDVYYPLLH